jgi:hypothetical protein
MQFGKYLSLFGDNAVIGAWSSSSRGAACIFGRDDDDQVAELRRAATPCVCGT